MGLDAPAQVAHRFHRGASLIRAIFGAEPGNIAVRGGVLPNIRSRTVVRSRRCARALDAPRPNSIQDVLGVAYRDGNRACVEALSRPGPTASGQIADRRMTHAVRPSNRAISQAEFLM